MSYIFCARPGTDESLAKEVMLSDRDLFPFPVERGDKKPDPFTKPLELSTTGRTRCSDI